MTGTRNLLFHSSSFEVVLLLVCCVATFFGFVAGQDDDHFIGEQQTSAQQYYRPYYYSRAVSRPNYRPSSSTRYPTAPSRSSTTGSMTGESGSCSTNSYQQFGICWADDSQRLQISPNLTIENFVRFHATNYHNIYVWRPSYFEQFCQQSRRFNSVGVMCVTTDEDDCISNRGTASALRCLNDNCICVVGEPYESIAQSIPSSSPLDRCGTHNVACMLQVAQRMQAVSGPQPIRPNPFNRCNPFNVACHLQIAQNMLAADGIRINS